MLRRRLAVLSTSALIAATLAAANPAIGSAAAPDELKVVAPIAFSPNGDGVQDRVPVRITLPGAASKVVVEVTSYYAQKVVRTVNLGAQPSGVTTWMWDGRSDADKRLADGSYVVEVRADWRDPGTPTTSRRDLVLVDTEFEPQLSAPTYGVADSKATYRVFPRSTVVTDALRLDTVMDNTGPGRSLRLVITNDRGRTVRSFDVDRDVPESGSPIPTPSGGYTYVRTTGRSVEWDARRGGRPLPSGRYTAIVTGRDRAGNSGRSDRLRIFVSQDRLVWKEKTVTVGAADSRTSECSFYPDEYKCGDLPDCGTVAPSTIYPGGLSYRSRPSRPDCREVRAQSMHFVEVPEATGVRGLAAVRVALDGSPTTAGEPDVGTLTVYGPYVRPDYTTSEVVGVTGRSEWVEDPLWGEGLTPQGGDYRVLQRDPAAMWIYATAGDDSVDVGTYTVDVRFLAIAR